MQHTTAAALTEATSTTEEIPACPGCGCEPEVVSYFQYANTKKRCGYVCTCGANVVEGQMIGVTHR